MMTFLSLPLAMSLPNSAFLFLLFLVVVPGRISWLERQKSFAVLTAGDEGAACALPGVSLDCTETFGAVMKELGRDYASNVWMLLKPTVTIMLLASVASAAVLTLLPWQDLLSLVTPLRLALVSLVSVFMPVPIALDVMFAAQLHRQGV